jgi:hypothetical protein
MKPVIFYILYININVLNAHNAYLIEAFVEELMKDVTYVIIRTISLAFLKMIIF